VANRLFFIQLYRWFPSDLKAMTIIRLQILVRWHRAGFRRYWRCKSRNLGGRPQISADLRALIRRMNVENALWGAPRIHGELLKLGFMAAQQPSPSTWLRTATGSRSKLLKHSPGTRSHATHPAIGTGPTVLLTRVAVVLLAASFPGQPETQLRALVHRYIEEATTREWSMMAEQTATRK
jgi:hypothetical protein